MGDPVHIALHGPAAEGQRLRLLAPPEPQRAGRSSPRYRVPWAELLRRVFAIDLLECPSCAGCLEVIAFIAEAGVAMRILDHLGMDSRAPPRAPARAPDDAGAFGDFQLPRR